MSQSTEAKPAGPGIAEANRAERQRFPFDDEQDPEDGRPGVMGTAQESVVRDAEGRTVWDLDADGFLDQEGPDTANPVRGSDLSNMTLVEGERGVFVI